MILKSFSLWHYIIIIYWLTFLTFRECACSLRSVGVDQDGQEILAQNVWPHGAVSMAIVKSPFNVFVKMGFWAKIVIPLFPSMEIGVNGSLGQTVQVLIFCVEFRELSHLTRDLSQAEKKINVVTSWANAQNDIYFTQNGRGCYFVNCSACNNSYFEIRDKSLR